MIENNESDYESLRNNILVGMSVFGAGLAYAGLKKDCTTMVNVGAGLSVAAGFSILEKVFFNNVSSPEHQGTVQEAPALGKSA